MMQIRKVALALILVGLLWFSGLLTLAWQDWIAWRGGLNWQTGVGAFCLLAGGGILWLVSQVDGNNGNRRRRM